MVRFCKSVFFRNKRSTFVKVLFYVFGCDFIGANIRFNHFKRALDRVKFKYCLDAGCGDGSFSFYVAERYKNVNVDAIDLSGEIIRENDRMGREMGLKNLKFMKKDLLKMDFNEKYDFAFSIVTLIYFKERDNLMILKKLKKSLKPHGYMYLDLPLDGFDDYFIMPHSYYKGWFEHTRKEQPGYKYGFEKLVSSLESLDFKVIDAHKSFGFMGRLAWEIDAIIKERSFHKLNIIILPFLNLLAWFDACIKNRRGGCISVLCQKR